MWSGQLIPRAGSCFFWIYSSCHLLCYWLIIIIDKALLFKGRSIGGGVFACQGVFCVKKQRLLMRSGSVCWLAVVLLAPSALFLGDLPVGQFEALFGQTSPARLFFRYPHLLITDWSPVILTIFTVYRFQGIIFGNSLSEFFTALKSDNPFYFLSIPCITLKLYIVSVGILYKISFHRDMRNFP